MSVFTLHSLARLLAETHLKKHEGSRTKRLLDKGLNKVAKKFGEEAFEFIIALKGEDRELVVWEAADLLYCFILALKVRGITLSSVYAELLRRTREPQHEKKAIP